MHLVYFGDSIPVYDSYFHPFVQQPKSLPHFEWSTEEEMTLQQVQAAVRATLPLGLSGPGNPMVNKLPVTDRDAVSLWLTPQF